MKRVSKKIYGIVAVLMAVIVMLSGCGAATDNPVSDKKGQDSPDAGQDTPKAKIKVLVSYDAKTLGPHYVDLWPQIVDELGYEMEFENPGTEAFKTKIKVALAGNELPDVFSVWGGSYLEPFIDSKSVLPVQDYIADSGLDYQKAYAQPYKDGNMYVIPSKDEAYAVTYVNMDLLKLIGKEVPRTWDDLLGIVEATNQYNKANGTTYAAIGPGVKDRWVGEVLYTVIVNSLDKDAFDKMMSGEIDMTDGVFLEAARRIEKLVSMGAFPNGFLQMASSETNEIFTTGQYVLYPHQSSVLKKFVAGMDPESLQVIPFPDCATPADPNYGKNLMNGNNKLMPGLCISKKAEFPDEAAKLALRFSEEANKINVMDFGSAGYIIDESLKPTKDFPTPIKQHAELVKNVDHLTSYWFAAVDAGVGEPWRDLTQKLYGQGVTPEDFVKEAQKIFSKK